MDKITNIDGLRAMVRPAILWMLGFGSFVFIMNGMESEYVDWWIKLTLACFAEWMLERPFLKWHGKVK